MNGLIKLAIRRPITILMVLCIIIVLGIVSYTRMKMELTPSMELPIVMITATYEGAGPEEMENLVTTPIENAVSSVENLDTLTSTSSKGFCMVFMEFTYGTDINQAVDDVRQKMDRVRLPDDVDTPTIMKMDNSSTSVCMISFASNDLNDYELKSLVDDKISPRLERQPGVAEVTVRGGREKEILVEVNRERLEGLGISMSDIASLLMAENVDQSGGNIDYGIKSYAISIKLQMESIDDIRQMPVRLSDGSVLLLSDIANVSEADVETTSYSRVNGENAISVSITGSSDGNVVETVNAIKDELELIAVDYPNVTSDMLYDQAETIEESVNGVIKNIVIGAILAILILFIFLKNVGLTAVIAVSMPVSIITAFVLLYFSGITLNVLSLGGLSIGVGMLVDSSVVAIESIYRYRTTGGYAKKTGTFYALKEVAAPIIASTLTSVVIFIPFLFVEGLMSQMFPSLSLAVVFSLLVSAAAALTVVPMMAGNVVSNVHRNKAPKGLNFINILLDLFDKGFTKVQQGYDFLLHACMRNKKKTLVIVLCIFVASMCLFPFIGVDLMPSTDEGTFTITATAPSGANVDYVNDYALKIESMLEDIPELEKVIVRVSGSGGNSRSSTASATLSCTLVDKTERSFSTDEMVERVREMTKNLAGVKISVSASSSFGSFGGGSGGTVNIYGDETDTLNSIYQQLKPNLSAIDGVREVSCDLDTTTRQVAVVLNKERMRSYGLNGSTVASQISDSVTGDTPTTLKKNGDETDIRISYPDSLIEEFSDLGSINISVGSGNYVPLSSIADIIFEEVPLSISKENQTRYVSVSYSVYDRDAGSVNSDIQKLINQMNLPDGYTMALGGTTDTMNEMVSTMEMVLLMAVAFIYMVMAAQFESLLNPFIMFLSIPLSLVGVLVLFFITNTSFSMTSLMGLLVLVGISVNNGIMLIDYSETVKKNENLSAEEAMLRAGPVRLRPVLMTALTTILAQIPVIFSTSSNSELLSGMGIVIAGGLTTCVFLTLIVVPIIYVYFTRFSDFTKRKLFRKKTPIETQVVQEEEEFI